MIRKERPPGQPDNINSDDDWLRRANDATETSVNFMNSNWRKQWENNLRMFQSQHPSGSKYNTEAYKYRSKLFRPKTRTAIRNTEAAGAAAFFSSMDVVSIEPIGEGDLQKSGAKFMKELMTFRLAQPELFWFKTVMGGLQDAQKMGVVCSYNYWKYSRDNPQGHPCVEITPIDRILFHPGANWIDPINTSPYVIRMIPMFVQDVLERDDWENPTKEEFYNAQVGFNEDLTTARHKNQENPQTVQVANINDFTMVWVHEVFMRIKGQDVVYYTLGSVKRLTAPVPRQSLYWHNERPITLGYYILETHKAIPPGVPEIGEQLQRECNEIVNSRQDNVKLALNKRYIFKRGANIDVRSLLRNAAGSATAADDPQGDIRELEWNDVTRSSYEEQNRIDVDFDDLVGGFNAGTIKNQRSLNETVGGMSMLQSAAGQITDYGLKTYSETWLEPTLRQVAKLIAFYESDETAVLVAAEKAQIKIENSEQLIALMKANLLLTVDIGVGSSNPGFRLERFISGITTFIRIAKEATPDMDIKEIAGELFAYLGYKDGSRFFKTEEDPRMEQLAQLVQELQQALESKQMDHEAELQKEALKADAAMERQRDQNEFELVKSALDHHAADNQVVISELVGQIDFLLKEIGGNKETANVGD